jgi:oxygen-independent coproporphyrinogen-3 oxidase
VPIGNHVQIEGEKIRDDDDDDDDKRHDSGFDRMNDKYINAIIRELHSIHNNKQNTTPTTPIQLQSIYFGGGTPSLAPVKSIAQIMDCIKTTFTTSDSTEITMEMDPGTFDRSKLGSLKQLGINRISLGVQSLDDKILEGMGRYHRHKDIIQAVQDLQTVYGPKINYSVDLISGVPGLSLAKWIEILQEVTGVSSSIFKECPPKHISIYDLQIEEGTVFDKWYKRTTTTTTKPTKQQQQQQRTLLKLPSDEECAFMYKYAAGYLRAKSYEHYEVSSYAAALADDDEKQRNDDDDGREKSSLYNSDIPRNARQPKTWRSRHNQIYWDYNSSWYAVGLGATSFVDGKLLPRPRRMDDYIKWVDEKSNITDAITLIDIATSSSSSDIDDDDDDDDKEDILPDLLLKRLRTTDGLDLRWLEDNYGTSVLERVLQGAQLGLELGLAEQTKDNILRLRDPDG